ncbi:hypothetical protein K439DRAFT_648917 [Ramaria rubella]|nr:hypothetical protein K439DRAFT_648917 [Ramaria rubella]
MDTYSHKLLTARRPSTSLVVIHHLTPTENNKNTNCDDETHELIRYPVVRLRRRPPSFNGKRIRHVFRMQIRRRLPPAKMFWIPCELQATIEEQRWKRLRRCDGCSGGGICQVMAKCFESWDTIGGRRDHFTGRVQSLFLPKRGRDPQLHAILIESISRFQSFYSI